MNEKPNTTYSPYEITLRERRKIRERNKQIVGVIIALLIIAGNVALFIYREQVGEWARATFGEIRMVVDRTDEQE